MCQPDNNLVTCGVIRHGRDDGGWLRGARATESEVMDEPVRQFAIGRNPTVPINCSNNDSTMTALIVRNDSDGPPLGIRT